MAIDMDIIESILDHGIDIKNRRIYFGSISAQEDEDGNEVAWRSIERIVRAIHMFENDAPNKPIELHMSSPGGSAYEMLRLIDIIEYSPCQFKFYGSGIIMSAATWIMAICDERYIHKNTKICIHDAPPFGSAEVPIKLTDRRIDQNEEEDLQNRLNIIYSENSKMPKEFFEILVKRDCYLSAEETVAIGLADKILEPKKRGNLRRMRIALLNKELNRAEMSKLVKTLYDRVGESRMPSKIEIHTAHDKFDSKVFVEKEPKEEKLAEHETQPVQIEINS
jgi:ATP-dependent protease ClpP protease subunit